MDFFQNSFSNHMEGTKYSEHNPTRNIRAQYHRTPYSYPLTPPLSLSGREGRGYRYQSLCLNPINYRGLAPEHPFDIMGK